MSAAQRILLEELTLVNVFTFHNVYSVKYSTHVSFGKKAKQDHNYINDDGH